MPECCLGGVVGRRQIGIGDEGSDGVPVIEYFAGERTHLGGIRVFIEKTGPFEAGQDGRLRPSDRRGREAAVATSARKVSFGSQSEKAWDGKICPDYA
jgi:hypothetical protein